ncbi:MAG: adenylyl-sulfate kinase [Nocardioidaceae bacterium]
MPEPVIALPSWTPTQRELDDLDLLVSGALGPRGTGFVDPRSGDASPLTLTVPDEIAEQALRTGQLDLIDPEGAPLARLTIEGTWPGSDSGTGLAGPVKRLAPNDFGPFRRLHLAPDEVHASNSPTSLLAVPVTRPLASSDIHAIADAARAQSRSILLVACVGEGMPDRMSGPALVRATLAAAQLFDEPAAVVAAAVADHGWSGAHGKSSSPNDWLLDSVAAAFADRTIRLPRESAGKLPESVAAITERARPARDEQGVVVFFTGLSGSGKSTLARALVDAILEQGERTVTSLDGDVVRHHLSKGLGFSRADRETNILRIGFVAAEIARHGGMAVCSPIAPFESTRAQVKEMVERTGAASCWSMSPRRSRSANVATARASTPRRAEARFRTSRGYRRRTKSR